MLVGKRKIALDRLFADGVIGCSTVFVAEAIIEKLEAVETDSELDWLLVLETIVAIADDVKVIDVDHHRSELQYLRGKHRKALARKRKQLLRQYE